MSIKSIEEKKFSFPITPISNLPINLEKLVSKIDLAKIDFFARIQGFFKILFFGPWKDFRKNVNIIVLEIANKKKLELYRSKKNLEYLKKCKKIKIYKTYDKKDVIDFFKLKRNFKIFEVAFVSINEENYKKLEILLNNIIHDNNHDYSLLISFQRLVNDEKNSQKIKDLISKKLKQELQIAQKRNDLKKESKNEKIQKTFYSNTWKTLTVGLFIIAGIVIASYGIYSYFENLQSLPCNVFRNIEKPIENISNTSNHNNNSSFVQLNDRKSILLELFKNGIYKFLEYNNKKLNENIKHVREIFDFRLILKKLNDKIKIRV